NPPLTGSPTEKVKVNVLSSMFRASCLSMSVSRRIFPFRNQPHHLQADCAVLSPVNQNYLNMRVVFLHPLEFCPRALIHPTLDLVQLDPSISLPTSEIWQICV